MQQILEHIVGIANDLLWSKLLIVLLLSFGIYFTFRLKFLQVRMLKEMVRVLREGAASRSKNSISPFQAFCISMAARVGTGNITGIAIAIALGGPGAIFWMWIIAIIGSASSFVESTLAQIYKVKDVNGFRGGPAYYMEKGLNKRWMGALFAVLITLSFGIVFNSVQSNTVSLAFENAFGTNRLTLGLILIAVFGTIIFGGVKRIAKLAESIVVVLAVLYIGVAFFVIFSNITQLPGVLALIVKNAFGFDQAAGGALGAALMQGVRRGIFSNEAGMGSAPNAAATATTSHPVKQGLIQASFWCTDRYTGHLYKHRFYHSVFGCLSYSGSERNRLDTSLPQLPCRIMGIRLSRDSDFVIRILCSNWKLLLWRNQYRLFEQKQKTDFCLPYRRAGNDRVWLCCQSPARLGSC